MRASIRGFHSPDINDLWNYQPEEPDCFGFLLQVLVGPEGEAGEELFDIEVVTPRWLLEKSSPYQVIVGRHHLIVFDYDFKRIANYISGYISRCSGENWREVAEEIGRLGLWEFEDYTEH